MIGSMAGNGSLAGALKACHSACLLEIFFFFFLFSCKGHTRQAYPCHSARSPVGPGRAKNSRDYMNSSSLSVGKKNGREDNVTLSLYPIPSSDLLGLAEPTQLFD
jgi:hypothetical protein